MRTDPAPEIELASCPEISKTLARTPKNPVTDTTGVGKSLLQQHAKQTQPANFATSKPAFPVVAESKIPPEMPTGSRMGEKRESTLPGHFFPIRVAYVRNLGAKLLTCFAQSARAREKSRNPDRVLALIYARIRSGKYLAAYKPLTAKSHGSAYDWPAVCLHIAYTLAKHCLFH